MNNHAHYNSIIQLLIMLSRDLEVSLFCNLLYYHCSNHLDDDDGDDDDDNATIVIILRSCQYEH